MLGEASAMDEAALSVLRRLDAGTKLSGLVRLAAGRVLAERFLIDRLRAFHERYPAIDLEVIGGSRVVSLAKREADVALRYGAPKDSELVARRVATISFGLYASRTYRDKLNAGHAPTFIGGSSVIKSFSGLRQQCEARRSGGAGTVQISLFGRYPRCCAGRRSADCEFDGVNNRTRSP